jgi:hypothetical protein
MASLSDFRRVADDVRNWGRWGDADELGTLNFISADKVAEAAGLVKHGKVFPLGVDFGSSGRRRREIAAPLRSGLGSQSGRSRARTVFPRRTLSLQR